MRKVTKRIMSVGLSLVMMVSVVSIASLKTNAEENVTMESQSVTEINADVIETTMRETETTAMEEAVSETLQETESITEENKTAETTAINTETAQDLTEEEQQKLGEKNHTDANTGIVVYGEDLPWYVKVVCERTDENAFQINYDNYMEALYGEDNEDWEGEDLDSEDEEDWKDEDLDDNDDSEDKDLDKEDWEDEDLDNKEDEDWNLSEYDEDSSSSLYNRLGYRADDEKLNTIAASYKISLYDTLEEKEYILPEGQTVKVYLPYLQEYLGYETVIVHWKEENVYDDILPQLFDKSKGEVVEWMWGDEYDYDLENEKIDIENYCLVFETGGFSEFGVLLCEMTAKDALALTSAEHTKLSPKTGYDLRVFFALMFGGGILSMIALVCRKREDDIV